MHNKCSSYFNQISISNSNFESAACINQLINFLEETVVRHHYNYFEKKNYKMFQHSLLNILILQTILDLYLLLRVFFVYI